ncbi:hypothetical protein AX16_006978 [Volvariella volvacea WC 439]|nr:hypothetical protein AX16_006978 [Volvariella volvacea WC 439]
MGRSEGEKKRKASAGGNVASGDVSALKKAKVEKVDGKGKGKARALPPPPASVVTSTADAPTLAKDTTAFQVIKATMVVSVPPRFAANPRAGVEEMLDGMVMRYIPGLRGVVLSHSSLVFLDKAATIKADCPYLVCNIGFDALVWSPAVGTKLIGKVNICSPDHVGLLVHQTFNVSIPRHHIPTDSWEFEYGAAENDPEFGPAAAEQGEGDEGEKKEGESEEAKGEKDSQEHASSAGRWVHRLTADPLGGQKGYVEFTVIGFTVANEMISLIGSIQPDPFSPHHVPPTAAKSKQTEGDDDQEDTFVGKLALSGDEEDAEDSEGDGETLGSEDSGGEDTFKTLGKKAGEVAAQRRAEAEKAAAAAEKEKESKKKKRKAEATEATEAAEPGKKRKKKKE